MLFFGVFFGPPPPTQDKMVAHRLDAGDDASFGGIRARRLDGNAPVGGDRGELGCHGKGHLLSRRACVTRFE